VAAGAAADAGAGGTVGVRVLRVDLYGLCVWAQAFEPAGEGVAVFEQGGLPGVYRAYGVPLLGFGADLAVGPGCMAQIHACFGIYVWGMSWPL